MNQTNTMDETPITSRFHNIAMICPIDNPVFRTKFIFPEFVSYLGERGVLCVGND